MIEIKEKAECCGCGACAQRCPKSCISMQESEDGFLYPVVNKEICIDCGWCEKVCPVLNQGNERKPLGVYAAKNKDEKIRIQSSSGGIFTLLAEQIIRENGVVFGARFNENWEVVHDYTENMAGLEPFRGSKYVQSKIGDTFKQTEYFLKAGRKVLFSGTPCQVAGLKLFLKKDYRNLLTVDFICHGVPSPMIWRMYLKGLVARQGDGKNSVLSHSSSPILNSIRDISHIEFRNKDLGWKKYSFALTLSVPYGHGVKNTVLLSEPYKQNIFMKGFLSDLYLRPSCYTCPVRRFKSGSDITLGDFWGIQNVLPMFDDDKGISAFMINRALELEIEDQIELQEVSLKDVIKSNVSLINDEADVARKSKFEKYFKVADLETAISKACILPVKTRVRAFVIVMLGKLGILKWIFRIWKRKKLEY